MSGVPIDEYVDNLISVYQLSEKMLKQAETDVAVAKKRREEARILRDETFAKLEEAKQKYKINNTMQSPVQSDGSRRIVKRTVTKTRSNGKMAESTLAKNDSGEKSDEPKTPSALVSPSLDHSTKQRRSSKVPKVPNLDTSESDEPNSAQEVPVSQGSSPSKQQSRRGQKLISPPGRRPMTISSSISKRVVPLDTIDLGTPILGICKGRSREWYEENLDCESLGLVKRFYQAALGAKTHAATNQVYIASVLLNDEWNDLASNISEVQELYIGVSSAAEGKETLRDRAARALVQPPQKEPLAVFFAPKNTLGTEDVYYGGHWKVVAGNMFEPPQIVKGTPRQCLVKLVFSGVDPELVKAINGDG